MKYLHHTMKARNETRRSGRRGEAGGYIALVSVLISSALLLAAGIGVSFRGIDALRRSLAEESSARARYLADSCAEEALLKLKANLGYAGNETIILGGTEACVILTVSGAGNIDRTVRTEASVAGYVRRVEVDVAVVNPVLNVRSWKLVP